MKRRKWPMWRKRQRNYVHGVDKSQYRMTPRRRAVLDELIAEATPIRVSPSDAPPSVEPSTREPGPLGAEST